MNVAVTGGYGFLGRHVVDQLRRRGHEVVRAHSEDFDLRIEDEAEQFVAEAEPDVVVHAAAYVGGIDKNLANPMRMLVDNLRMGLNVLEAADDVGASVVMIGTACSYPGHLYDWEYPTPEHALWDGRPADPTAQYGIAKLTLFEVAQTLSVPTSFIIPTNLYGPDDNFDPQTGHVIASLVSRFAVSTKPVDLHGDGFATRDFLHVDDAARGIVDAVERGTDGYPINLGSGRETSIRELAEILGGLMRARFNFTGKGPVGNQRRFLDISRAVALLGWGPEIPLEAGLLEVVDAYEARSNP